MNHNLTLNDDAAEAVHRAILDLFAARSAAVSRIEALVDRMSARTFDEMFAEVRAALGTIGDATWRIDQIVFHTDRDDSDYAIDTSRHPSSGIRRPVLRMIGNPDRITSCDSDCSCKGGK